MPKIVSVAHMRRIERAADAAGWSYEQMMLRAGGAVAAEVEARLGAPAGRSAMILVGSGNNGGDGLVAGCRLREAGWEVAAVAVSPRSPADPHAARLLERGGRIVSLQAEPGALDALTTSCNVLIDALLGTGFRLPLRPDLADVLSRVAGTLARRARPPLLVAVDCPSGLDCDTGEKAPEALKVDVTVTLGAAKPGLLRGAGAHLSGEIVVGDIGLDSEMPELREVQMELVDAKTAAAWLPRRESDAHKGTFGKIVVAAGSVNYPGSAALAGRAAYRVGAGLVCLAVPGGVQLPLVSAIPEAIWAILPHEMGVVNESAAEVLRESSEGARALVLGPGLGREETTRRFLQRLLEPGEVVPRGHIGFLHPSNEAAAEARPLPQLVLDADGLRHLAGLDGWQDRLPKNSILTPHPGEMSALTGLPVETVQANREGIAREKAAEWGQIVVLKGANTVVAAPDGRAWVLPFATAALAKAGTGDVLAGAIGGLCAQGVAAAEAAVLGAYLHGRAGVVAAERAGTTAGVLASEVADLLAIVIAELERVPGSS